MVRRFIEEQHVRLRHEGPREQNAASPAARQRVHDGIGWHTEARERRVRRAARCAIRRAPRGIVLETSELLEEGRRRRRRVEIDGRSMIGRDEVAQVTQTVGNHVEDRPVGGEWNVLLRASTRRSPGWHPDGAVVWWLLAPDNPQERGISPAPFLPTTAMRSPRSICIVGGIEERQVSERVRDLVERNQRHRLRRGLSSAQRTANDRAVQRLGTDERCTAHGPRSTVRTPFACRGERRGRRSDSGRSHTPRWPRRDESARRQACRRAERGSLCV